MEVGRFLGLNTYGKELDKKLRSVNWKMVSKKFSKIKFRDLHHDHEKHEILIPLQSICVDRLGCGLVDN